MMKMNLRKMVMAAAMAAFMVYAPAMAEEDIIVEEPFEAVEETVIETEAAVIGIDVMEIETIAEKEIPAEVAQAAELVETEANAAVAEAQSFLFENDEVIIRATAAAELPAGVQMQAVKLAAGSAEYEAAKAAAQGVCGADESAEYSFYSVIFTVNGEEIAPAEGSVVMQVEFKAAAGTEQSVLHIDENGAEDVTAQGSASSVNFTI